jgi:hypothetical protein
MLAPSDKCPAILLHQPRRFLRHAGSKVPGCSRIGAIILEICRKELKRAELLPDIANNYGRKSGQKNLAWVKNKRGYRAEVRRERKKRDILSPVNVLHN